MTSIGQRQDSAMRDRAGQGSRHRQMTYIDSRAFRSNLRLASALIMLAFVISHLTAHSVLLISFERAQAALNILMYPWHTLIGTTVLLTAFFVHYANALWSIYLRRSLRPSTWELTQLCSVSLFPPC